MTHAQINRDGAADGGAEHAGSSDLQRVHESDDEISIITDGIMPLQGLGIAVAGIIDRDDAIALRQDRQHILIFIGRIAVRMHEDDGRPLARFKIVGPPMALRMDDASLHVISPFRSVHAAA